MTSKATASKATASKATASKATASKATASKADPYGMTARSCAGRQLELLRAQQQSNRPSEFRKMNLFRMELPGLAGLFTGQQRRQILLCGLGGPLH
jgi:hypothetical protein